MKAGGACPSNGDVATMQAFLSQGTTAVGGALAGAPLQACGNGVIDPGEQCDQSNLNGQSCLSQGFAAGVLACGPGCILDTSGCSSARLVDNGDGTASDLQTGLMWEKKTFGECINLIGGHPIACALNADCTNNGGGGVCQSCPHCLNGFYTWTASGSPYPPNGTAFTTFLYALNGGTSLVAGDVPTGCFAGHCDWRLPTGYELGSLAFAGISNCGVTAADTFCTDPVLGPGLNALNGYFYWSSTSSGYDLSSAWVLGPGNGGDGAAVIPFAKTSAEPVRAVRGGP
jgi:hypothetical protein